MSKPLCPLMSMQTMHESVGPCEIECKEGKCAWWLNSVYSTESKIQEGRCAITFIAEKNVEGLLVV